ncbi:TA system VapC family ribonuclease toxin [Ornithinimicrobium avium]|uniref:Ribonuclease VapC n=1 Tax=Ornithinimicrobium avium TaxID=2283195 RepID=A0A345NM26_9MICO|nr:TA system VapC family ribonuclease toxin [Ornithinimicrobium avium]AXH96084.1 PIN domain-containing protein [Ornithinimicrobium avium]
MIIDANVLLYAVDSASVHHAPAAAWLVEALNGDVRVGLPWQSLGAFVRIATHPRVSARPLTAAAAQDHVDSWLAAGPAWVPPATERTAEVYARLARRHHVTANLVPDAQLAALALELGVPVVSADSDFARFDEVRWINPLAPARGASSK